MKLLSLLALTFFIVACDGSDNIRDRMDSNVTPAPMEEREEEYINSHDVIDENSVPANEEEREREEEKLEMYQD